MTHIERPDPGEYHPHAETYVRLVTPGAVLAALETNGRATVALLREQPEERGSFAYAPGKWTLKQVVAHMTDTERVFAARALYAARGDAGPLPGFDQDAWANAFDVTRVPLASLVTEFETVRASTLFLLRHLAPDAWTRRVHANGVSTTVRALAYMIAGHELHHASILRREYVPR